MLPSTSASPTCTASRMARCSKTMSWTVRTLQASTVSGRLDLEAGIASGGSFQLEAMSGDDPTALIGLPLIALSRMLRAAGVQLP